MTPSHLTTSAPHVRSHGNLQRLLIWFVIASVPAAIAGCWAAPARVVEFAADVALAIAVCGAWELAFSRLRNRPVDPAWLVNGWLFALLLAPGTPAAIAAAAISFGVVLGHHVFGGTGRAPVSPALLGALAIHFGYPELATSNPAPTPDQLASHAAIWWSTFLAEPEQGIGSTSAFACLLVGAPLLTLSGAASVRVIAGAIGGIAITATLVGIGGGGALPWYWHLALGNLAFSLVFLATDPSTGALTRGGRWAHGLLAGAFAVLIRELDPTHPDGALFAVLMAGLMVPVADHVVQRLYVVRRQRRARPPVPGP